MPTVRVVNTGALSCDLITEDQTIARFCRAGSSIDVVLAENQQFHIAIYRKAGSSWNITLQALDYPAIHLFRDSFGDLDQDWNTSGTSQSDSPFIRGIFWLAVPAAQTPPPPDTSLQPGDLRLNGFFADRVTESSVRYTVKILNTSSTHSGQAIVRVEIKTPSNLTVAALEDTAANFPVSTAEYVKAFDLTGLSPSTTYTAHLFVFSDQPLLTGGPKTFTTLASAPPPPPPPTPTFDALSLAADRTTATFGDSVTFTTQTTQSGSPVAISGVSLDFSVDGNVEPLNLFTDANGQATTTFGAGFFAAGTHNVFAFVDTDTTPRFSNVVTLTISDVVGPPPPGNGGGGGGGLMGNQLITGLLGLTIVGAMGASLLKIPSGLFGGNNHRRKKPPVRRQTRSVLRDVRNAMRTCPQCRKLGHKCRRCSHG